MKSWIANKKAFFSMEAVLSMLVVAVILSWIVLFLSKSATVQSFNQNEQLARAHAEYVIGKLKKLPAESWAEEIRHGNWNFPNSPAIMAEGLIALPNESILTSYENEAGVQVAVVVHWQNPDGQYKEISARLKNGGSSN